MSVTQRHSALNWHLRVLELKGGGKGYSLYFLQPKDVNPLKDFHHLLAVQLPRLRNTEITGPLEQEGPRVEVRRDFESEVETDLSHPPLDGKKQFFFLLLCSTCKQRTNPSAKDNNPPTCWEKRLLGAMQILESSVRFKTIKTFTLTPSVLLKCYANFWAHQGQKRTFDYLDAWTSFSVTCKASLF